MREMLGAAIFDDEVTGMWLTEESALYALCVSFVFSGSMFVGLRTQRVLRGRRGRGGQSLQTLGKCQICGS